MLKNERFLSQAPAEKIAQEKEKQEAYKTQMEGVLRELEQLKKM